MARSARAGGRGGVRADRTGRFPRATRPRNPRPRADRTLAGPGGANLRARSPARRQRRGRDGLAVQGDGDLQSGAADAARIRAEMSEARFLTLATLAKLPGVRHAFFTRNGGVSEGVYASLNGGVGSRDAAEAVAENRARMARRSRASRPPAARAVSGPLARRGRRLRALGPGGAAALRRDRHQDARPRGRRHRRRLRHDPVRRPEAGVIGAAHAGWKGALTA